GDVVGRGNVADHDIGGTGPGTRVVVLNIATGAPLLPGQPARRPPDDPLEDPDICAFALVGDDQPFTAQDVDGPAGHVAGDAVLGGQGIQRRQPTGELPS